MNEYSVHPDFESYRAKLGIARDAFHEVYSKVKDKVDASLRLADFVPLVDQD